MPIIKIGRRKTAKFKRNRLSTINKTKKNLNIKFQKGVLNIVSRDSRFAQLIKIVEEKDVIRTYKPEKSVFTGVSIGGITHGSIKKVGGPGTASVHSWKYNLVLVNTQEHGGVIKRIKLTPELSQQAQQSDIREYLSEEGDEIIVVIPPKPYDFKSEEIIPSFEKCKAILNWLSMTT